MKQIKQSEAIGNGLERLHGETKRRIEAVGAFPDRASARSIL